MKKKVIIIGAGFAGLNAAKQLSKYKEIDVTIIDKKNHHLFQPLLYQVATAGLNESDIAYPIRSIFRKQKNVTVYKDTVENIDFKEKVVITKSKRLYYDYLIIAAGAEENYFGNTEWKKFAPTLKTLKDAQILRNKILNAFEMAEKATSDQEMKKYLTFIVIGGGPTGVELAGAIGEMTRITLAKDFRNIDPRLSRILLIEAGKRILPSFDENLTSKAVKDLESLGVQVWTNSLVTEITDDSIKIGNEQIEAATVIWAAGIKANSLSSIIPSEKDKMGRVFTANDLSLKNFPEVFVCGDLAHFIQNGEPLPGIAPVAMQQGKHVAKQIINDLKNKKREEFVYFDKGQLATIGKSKAIAEIRNLKLSGFLAWITWIFVHILYLTGFKNRIFVTLQWAWSYITFKKGARLIIDDEK
ncbi:FAD-dependent pyridine nucleotide-disulphide oxidoreductase [Deferribacter desulfuricans SSM1]|uniref:NADH:ubiquinone reductase (non-electrogenic) n=1 Tax=Deferribacter desulfuricans (strain DSM 14783 / JCM 11476 / NBRC 101012 / SSM1) TaxID=639282 RepID=D3PD69_DEFDS|nr:NAD(P)/FAD-dependent oxidoreductase [Deferribacter desulfuricans]BAI80542.1 FAD-dependent pyridine nucleotide-disulphide oxidoreductase [Deferribacter desulfuricans SSM1]